MKFRVSIGWVILLTTVVMLSNIHPQHTWAFPVKTFTPTPTVTLTPSVTPTPMATLTPAPSSTPTKTPPTRTPDVQESCPGAPPIYVQIGQTVVVDFTDSDSAMRIMTESLCGATCTIIQAYDGEKLNIVDGPRCGKYQKRNVWYWYVFHPERKKYGWAMEGLSGDRWMCDLDHPECGR